MIKDVLPMHMILNVKPAATLWFTSWSGKESNPTCPPSCRLRSLGLLDPWAPGPFSPLWFVSLDGAFEKKKFNIQMSSNHVQETVWIIIL